MNYNFMQELQKQKDQGKDLGSQTSLLDNVPGNRLGKMEVGNPAKNGLTPARTALANAPGQAGKLAEDFPDTVGKAFANEIIRRMDEKVGEDGQPKDPDSLRQSLGSTIDWVRERYGEDTAAAAAGMILQSTSAGVNENSLGNGLLSTLQFIDRNFGFAAGDEAIAHFNSGINQSVNEFFDNGQDELFFAVESGAAAPSATQDLTTRVIAQALANTDEDDTTDFEELTDKLLNDLKGELDKIGELQDLTQKLEADFNPTQATTQAALAAYEAAPHTNEPQFTSLNV